MKKIEVIKRLNSCMDGASTRFRRIAVPLWNVLAFSAADERIAFEKDLCVAVERTGVSVAYGTRFLSSASVKGVKHYPSADHTYPQPKEVATYATLAVRELGAAVTGITLSIPKAWAIIRSAEFPAAVCENISNAVTFEFDRLVPFSPDEAFYDFSMAGKSADKIRIVIAAAKAELINKYCDALKEQGFTVNRVTLNLAGMGALCRPVIKHGDFIFIGTEGDEYEGALFIDGSLAEVVNGRFSAEDDKARAEAIAAEIKPLMAAASRGDNVRHICALLRDGRPALRERVRTAFGSPVVMLDEQKKAVYAAAGGVMESLLPGLQKLNLLKKGERERTRLPLALTAILVALLIAFGIAYFLAPIQVEEQRLREIDRRIKLSKSEARDSDTLKKEIDALKGEIATINGFRESRPMTLTILKELTTILPKSAWLTRMRVVEARVEIEGYATSASELLSRLESSKYFGKAEFASPTFRDVRMNSDRFNIKMEIKGMKQTTETQNKNQTRGRGDAGTRGNK